MRNLFIFMLVLPILIGCDFTGSSTQEPTTTQQSTNYNNQNQKKQAPADYYQVKKDTAKKNNVTEITFSEPEDYGTNSTLSTVESKKKEAAEIERYKQQVEDLQLKLQTVNKQSDTKLVKSTFNVKNEEVVKIILYEMYVKELESLKAANKSEDILSDKFKKFFTIEYCDDRVLEWLDDFVDKNTRFIARRMRVNYTRLTDPDATAKQIISSK